MDKLVNLFSRVLEVEPDEINDESSPENLENWDSLKFMQLVAEFESEFDVTIDISTIMTLKTFSDFKRLISSSD
jgi:acyl carrier protein